MWEDGTWVLEEREPVKKGRHSRTAWLKHVNQITEGMVPPGHMLWSVENGKGKDRSLTRVFLLPMEDGDFEVEAWIAYARDFKIRTFQTDIILTRHLIERMFLRLPTMDRTHVTKNLCPVIRFLILGTDRWSRRNMPEVFDLLTDEGRFPVKVMKKQDRFVLKTFVHASLLTDYQRTKYFHSPVSNPRVKYLVLDEGGAVTGLNARSNGCMFA
jgi:hypothetical protein